MMIDQGTKPDGLLGDHLGMIWGWRVSAVGLLALGFALFASMSSASATQLSNDFRSALEQCHDLLTVDQPQAIEEIDLTQERRVGVFETKLRRGKSSLGSLRLFCHVHPMRGNGVDVELAQSEFQDWAAAHRRAGAVSAAGPFEEIPGILDCLSGSYLIVANWTGLPLVLMYNHPKGVGMCAEG